MTRKLKKDKANISRELEKLQLEGLVLVHGKGKDKSYSFNKDYNGADELAAFFLKRRKDDISEKFNRKWIMAEDILNMDPYFSQIWTSCFVNLFQKPSGLAYKWVANIYKDYHLWFYFEENDAVAVAEHLVKRFTDNPEFMREINENIVKHSDMLVDFSKTVPEERLNDLSAKELWNLNQKHIDLHSAYYQWAWIPVASDMFTNTLTERGKQIIRDHGVPEEKINDTLALLTTPVNPSLIKVEHDSLRDIGIRIQKNENQLCVFQELFRKFKEEDVKEFGLYTHSPAYEAQFEKRVRDLVEEINPAILDAIQQHYTRYFYTKFLFTEEQGVYSFEHYLKELVRMVNSSQDLAAEAARENDELKRESLLRTEASKQLKLKPQEARFFEEWAEFMITKIYRRYAQLFALYKINPILSEIASRIGLTLKQTKFMSFKEMKAALLDGKKISEDELNLRIKGSVLYFDSVNQGVFYSGSDADKAMTMIKGTEDKFSRVTELKGQTGCSGSAVGHVKIVNVISDMEKVKDGDILVSVSTQPDLLPAMKRSAAFVTEQGGVTSHAAIVAREMRKPCIIGTRIATKVLKDGMLVEVNATAGTVRIIS